MTPDPARIAALVTRLLALHQSLSWRHIAKQYYPNVPPGTLNRIAKEGGAYMPKDRKILRALGLIQRRARTDMEKQIATMAAETRKALKVRP